MELSLEFETEQFRAWTEAATEHLTKEGSRDFLRVVAFDFLRRVIQKTPVRTGRARAGWHSYLLANGRPTSGGDPVAVAEGRRASAYREDFTGSEQFIILVNAVRYIVLLEFGSSRQAPAGMMRLTFREIQARTLTRAMTDQLSRTVRQANRTARAKVRRRLPG